MLDFKSFCVCLDLDCRAFGYGQIIKVIPKEMDYTNFHITNVNRLHKMKLCCDKLFKNCSILANFN